MTTFTVSINLENAAFDGSNSGAEVARILHKLAVSVTSEDVLDGGPHIVSVLRDVNGNRVGKAEVSE